jgi:DNA polymerase
VPTLYVDFETRSECDLRKHGAWIYSKHPSTEVLCMAWKIDDGPINLWTRNTPFPAAVYNHVLINRGLNEAHNAFFEYVIWHNTLKLPVVPIQQWRCSAALAATHGLPRSLAGASAAAGLDVEKDREGHLLMLKMCKLRKPTKNNPAKWHETPEDLKRLGEYCVQDVATEYALSQKLGHLSDTEQRVWHTDLKINLRGVQCDVEAVKGAIDLLTQLEERGKRDIERVTKGAVKSPAQVVALCDWIKQRGIELDGLAKANVSEALAREDLPPEVREVLEIRQANSKSSTKKYQAMLDRADTDGRIRSLLLYYGAHTGRWAGSGIQIQNFPRGTLKAAVAEGLIDAIKDRDIEYLEALGDPSELLSSCLRSMLTARPGYELIGADYSSIEARVLLWLADDQRGLDLFRGGRCIYRDMAGDIYGKLPDDVTDAERMLGKVAILGLGYGMGWKKFVLTCKGWGISISDAMAERVVFAYRNKYAKVKQLWYDMNSAAINAIRYGTTSRVGRCVVSRRDGNMIIRLPSGREIVYNKPELSQEPAPWDPEQLIDRISYESPRGRTDTYGAKLIENVTQAAARDLMAGAMLELEDAEHDVVLSVHDEAVVEVPEGTVEEWEVSDMLCKLPAWAAGLPVAAEGWVSRRFRK